eukprot:gb/GEZN01014178.1/.p1 GENE.gb/GEZN01014178.1/~~gb/GEZN01014178.1/.p1  ORF type:complete len:281 (-),score=23.48 gb/GEZN01014178.1/:85-927(-)
MALFAWLLASSLIAGEGFALSLPTALVTSIYFVKNPARLKELQDVLKINLLAFDKVALLHAGEAEETLGLWKHPQVELYSVPIPAPSENQYSRIFNSTAYLYSTFFRFCREKLPGYLVTISNGDIAFPADYRDKISRVWSPGMAFVLSRSTIKCPTPCPRRSACVNRCETQDSPSSFDSFVIASDALTEAIFSKTNHPQNQFGAENQAAAVLAYRANLTLFNLCRVKTWHHHCNRDRNEYKTSDVQSHICKNQTWKIYGHGIKCYNPPRYDTPSGNPDWQ